MNRESKILCPDLSGLLRKTLMCLCEVNVVFHQQLDICGSIHIKADGMDVASLLLHEGCTKAAGVGGTEVLHHATGNQRTSVSMYHPPGTTANTEETVIGSRNAAGDEKFNLKDFPGHSLGENSKHAMLKMMEVLLNHFFVAAAASDDKLRDMTTSPGQSLVDCCAEAVESDIAGEGGFSGIFSTDPRGTKKQVRDTNAATSAAVRSEESLGAEDIVIKNEPQSPRDDSVAGSHASDELQNSFASTSSVVGVDSAGMMALKAEPGGMPGGGMLMSGLAAPFLFPASLAGWPLTPQLAAAAGLLNAGFLPPHPHAGLATNAITDGVGENSLNDRSTSGRPMNHVFELTPKGSQKRKNSSGNLGVLGGEMAAIVSRAQEGAASVATPTVSPSGEVDEDAKQSWSSTSSSSSNKAKCFLCDRTFTTWVLLKLHLERWHKEQFVGQCKVCSMLFTSLEAYASHCRKCRFRCSSCARSFGTKASRDTHFKTEHQQLRFSCTYCSLQYRSRDGLQCHMNSRHSKNRIYNCPRCAKSFYTRQALYTHKKNCSPQ